jgi:hypothetical protein
VPADGVKGSENVSREFPIFAVRLRRSGGGSRVPGRSGQQPSTPIQRNVFCRFPDLFPGSGRGRIVPDDELLNGRAWVEEEIRVLARALGLAPRLEWEDARPGEAQQQLWVETLPGNRSSVRVASRLIEHRINAPGEWAIVRVELLSVFRTIQGAAARR